jgi:ParB-like chromosome segregation protein Spo0J
VREVIVPFRPDSRRRRPTELSTVRACPARIARQLSLAHQLQHRLDLGEFRNQASLARALGFSRERISKLLNLVLLAPEIQEELLHLDLVPGHQLTEASLAQSLLASIAWTDQSLAWSVMRRKFLPHCEK